MRREIERMMRLRFFSILFCVALVLVLVGIIFLSVIITTGDYSGVNKDFARIEDSGAQEIKGYELDKFEEVYLFSEKYKNQRTLFTKKLPNLKIVNSDRYYVEISASPELTQKLDVQVVDEKLVVTFDNKHYADVIREGRTYRGLFVECEGFEVTVYAPIKLLRTSAEITLDYQAPKTENINVYIDGEVTEAKIYDVDCNSIQLVVCGMSSVILEGKASSAQIVARHNSKVDAGNFQCKRVNASVTCQLFGFSYINYQDGFEHSFFESGFVVTVVLIAASAIFALLFIVLRIKFFKQKKEIDEYIAKAKAEEKYLKIPDENEEKVLQNEE